jgi:hypothetical protein
VVPRPPIDATEDGCVRIPLQKINMIEKIGKNILAILIK